MVEGFFLVIVGFKMKEQVECREFVFFILGLLTVIQLGM